MVIRRRLQLIFPGDRVGGTVIYEMGKRFRVIPSIRRASILGGQGWVVMELSGEASEVVKAIEDLKSQEIQVSSAEGDFAEGWDFSL